jgi:hypothetical protein
MLTFVLYVLAVYYATKTLLIEDSIVDEEGPWSIHRLKVLDISRHYRSVMFLDILRASIPFLSPYLKTESPLPGFLKEQWYALNWDRLPVWQCPHCLGFWMSFWIGTLVVLSLVQPFFIVPVWLLAAAGANSLLSETLWHLKSNSSLED